jgi:pimeloyl-ACP methyl ester carboxylesterase
MITTTRWFGAGVVALLTALGIGARAAAPTPQALRMGALTLERCTAPARWCGTLQRPLDPSGKTPGALAIYFEYYPHSGPGPARGTLVPAEGGPGYPTSESREDYLALIAPLAATHDLLIMDYRGTGRSHALDCPQLQQAPALTIAATGACGRYLGASARFYSVTQASDDLAALLKALEVPGIDLYGESSGTFFAQVFAMRHPEQVHSLILDGAYPLKGSDLAWWPDYARATRERFNQACARDPGCAQRPGDSLQHIAPALDQLRRRPFTASVPLGAGRSFHFTADASALASVMFSGYPPLTGVRETDAAARAFVAGDQIPLLRLMAETLSGLDSRDPTHDPRLYSSGYEAVVSCLDEAQIYDMSLAPAQRQAQRDELVRRREREHPDSYAPFTFAEYGGMPLDYTFIDQCVQWPADPGAPLVRPPAQFPAMPVLVVSGDLDTMTGVTDGRDTAAQFPHGHHVVIVNGLHVNALPRGRTECAVELVRRFISTGSTGDESCAAGAPPVRLVKEFAVQSAGLTPAAALPGNGAEAAQLRSVSAILQACADVIARAATMGAGEGRGLRGGTFAAAAMGEGYALQLHGVRWTSDVALSGRIDWPGRRSGLAHARLAVRDSGGTGTLSIEWPAGEDIENAEVRGTLDGRRVAAVGSAP